MRIRVSRLKAPIFLSTVLLLSLAPLSAQSPLDQAIGARFPLTIATAGLDDIVTPGAVMTLKQKGILMFATTAGMKAQLYYKDGQIKATSMTAIAASNSILHKSTIVQRTYVTNEKLWLIDVKDAVDGVTLQMLSDAVGDVRYTTFIKFPFPKGSTPSPDEITAQIAQIMAPEGGPEPPPPAAPARRSAPPVVIPPPPPPPDMPPPAPPTLQKGQTKDEVISGFGSPTKVVKISATKEIDYFQNRKVTFENGKVSKIE